MSVRKVDDNTLEVSFTPNASGKHSVALLPQNSKVTIGIFSFFQYQIPFIELNHFYLMIMKLYYEIIL